VPAAANGKAQPRPSRWPRHTPTPSVLDMLTREELPVPHPQSFGYPETIEKPALATERRATAPVALKVTADASDITGALRPSLGRWPVTTTSVPKAAFP
jgi:hypothetical protein